MLSPDGQLDEAAALDPLSELKAPPTTVEDIAPCEAAGAVAGRASSIGGVAVLPGSVVAAMSTLRPILIHIEDRGSGRESETRQTRNAAVTASWAAAGSLSRIERVA